MLKLLLLQLAERYAAARGLSISRVSTLAFSDGKVLTRISGGGDITTGRLEAAVCWFSDNWPDDVDWPLNVPRPRNDINASANLRFCGAGEMHSVDGVITLSANVIAAPP